MLQKRRTPFGSLNIPVGAGMLRQDNQFAISHFLQISQKPVNKLGICRQQQLRMEQTLAGWMLIFIGSTDIVVQQSQFNEPGQFPMVCYCLHASMQQIEDITSGATGCNCINGPPTIRAETEMSIITKFS